MTIQTSSPINLGTSAFTGCTATTAGVCMKCGVAGGRHAPSCIMLRQELTFRHGELINTSGLEPLGYSVLVLPYEPEIDSTLIIVPANVRERTAMVETRVIVIACGPCCWEDEVAKGHPPRAKVGDKVFLPRFAGIMAVGPLDRRQYRMVNDRDIYCRITGEEQK